MLHDPVLKDTLKKFKNKYINITGKQYTAVKDLIKIIGKSLGINKKIDFSHKKVFGTLYIRAKKQIRNASNFKMNKDIKLKDSNVIVKKESFQMIKTQLINIKRSIQENIDRSSYLRLDANERVIPFEKKLLKKVKERVNSFSVPIYPKNNTKILNTISNYENIDKKFISCFQEQFFLEMYFRSFIT